LSRCGDAGAGRRVGSLCRQRATRQPAVQSRPEARRLMGRRSRTRRLAVAVAVGGLSIAASVAIAIGGNGAADAADRVRAIFDTESLVIPGEAVKVAGVKVGTIDSLDRTPQDKAAVILRIEDPAFAPCRRDAHCAIRLQSLIGEQFVDCEPTEPRSDG